MVTDWLALLTRLEACGIDIGERMQVSRVTVWRWRRGVVVPNGHHAAQLVLLDVRTVDGHTAKIVGDVTPVKQV